MKILLALETALTLPFFLLSWFLCSMYFAVKAGNIMAKADSAEKLEVLTGMLGGEKKPVEAEEKVTS
jgi:hypothetical protein